MGLGDEIMALGRAEALFEETGRKVSIVNEIGRPRGHDAWKFNPAWDHRSTQTLMDCAAYRPYIKHWQNKKLFFNLEHKPRAGRMYLTDQEIDFNKLRGDYIIIAPYLKDHGSKNKAWSEENYIKLIQQLDMPIYQLVVSNSDRVIQGAKPYHTPHFRLATSVISGARLVITNEGGAHHMAASMRKKAVVFFGSFIPPSVTGYDFHENIGIDTDQGYCGEWEYCEHCAKAKKQITVEYFKQRVERALQ